MEGVRAHLFFNGNVQGVFFRQKTSERAKRFNVSGWIKNLEDGRVEAVFEGRKEDVEGLIKEIEAMPFPIRIEGLDIFWEEYKGVFQGFEIK